MSDTTPAADAGRVDREAFARSFASFLEWVQETEGRVRPHPVVQRLRQHLGERAGEAQVVTRSLPPFQRVNLQLALEAWSAEPGRRTAVQGIGLPPHYTGIELGHLLHGQVMAPLRAGSPDVDDLPSGPGRTTAVWRTALLLVEDARGRYALLVRGPEQHQPPSLALELAGLATDAAQAVLAELDALRSARDVHRGQLLELGADDMGAMVITFPVLPRTEREDVVLPEEVLARIERHTLDVAARREALRAAGQHLKRGLLLFGPPGTGKTHTTRYVVTHLPGATVVLLSGRALHLVGAVTELARALQPSVVVLEDVDLVAEDRTHGPGPNPVLFELLDAMDGAAADADLLFLLTTNRADLLEAALAARPGRVDVALEIGLPDAAARRRLLEVHSRSVPLAVEEADLRRAVDRTAGVTASFLKEVVRRAVLEAALALSEGDADGVREVTGEHLERALDDLLDASQSVTRALLGVPAASTG